MAASQNMRRSFEMTLSEVYRLIEVRHKLTPAKDKHEVVDDGMSQKTNSFISYHVMNSEHKMLFDLEHLAPFRGYLAEDWCINRASPG